MLPNPNQSAPLCVKIFPVQWPLRLNMKTRRLVNRWMPVIGWMLLIFIGSTDAFSAEQTSRFLVPLLLWFDPHISIGTILTLHVALRKLGHLIAYAVLAALLWRALRGQTAFPMKMWRPALVALVVAAIYAAFDEFHQSFVPSRTASTHDVAIDIGGAVVGLAIYWAFALRRKPQMVY